MDTQRELAKLKELVQENHKILKRINTRAKIGTTVYVIKWIVIIFIALGVYTFVEPALDGMIKTYSSVKDAAETISEVKSSIPGEDSSGILNFFKKK